MVVRIRFKNTPDLLKQAGLVYISATSTITQSRRLNVSCHGNWMVSLSVFIMKNDFIEIHDFGITRKFCRRG